MIKGVLNKITQKKESREDILKIQVKSIIGVSPKNISIYRLAFLHSSAGKEIEGINHKESNERLEFLGDSVLGMVTANYLYRKFPYKDEGFLTEIRSRIVSRESLNNLGKKIGLKNMIEHDFNGNIPMNRMSIFGDTLEALIGAIYLDKGFSFVEKFIINKILLLHFDLDEIIENNPNFKSIIFEYCQKEGKEIRFETKELVRNKTKEFVSIVIIEEKEIAEGLGFSKKKAEQIAAMKACKVLNLN